MISKVFFYSARSQKARSIMPSVNKAFLKEGYSIVDSPSDADVIVCAGGDGTLLRLLREFDFPIVPIAGINTGHLGFFQEYTEKNAVQSAAMIRTGDFSIQKYRLLKAVAESPSGRLEVRALNDIVFRRSASGTVHLRLTAGNSVIESFSGDGIILSSSAGSTGYNYSVGGSIVDPGCELIQITPLAPMNTSSYRSFTTGLIFPPEREINIFPEGRYLNRLMVVADGCTFVVDDFEKATVTLTKEEVSIIRRKNYDFWDKVKDKFF